MITLEDLNTETLNEEYAFEFWKCYKQLPKAEVLNRAILISRIKSMQDLRFGEQDAIANYNRSSSHF